MHYSRTYCLIIFVFFYSYARSQDTMNSSTVENNSYRLYMAKNWNELEKYGNVAIEHGIDYYYLQMRLGLAYYEQHNYLKAEEHFREAITFNAGDGTAMEYIYYCCLFNGRYEEARWYSKSFDEPLKHELKIDSLPCVSAITFEGGVERSDSNKSFGNLYYGALGMEQYINNSFSLFHTIKYTTQIDHLFLPANPDDSIANRTRNYSKIAEYEYYLKATIPLGNKWVVSPAIHWLGVATNDTLRHPPSPPIVRPAPGTKPVLIPGTEYDTSFFSNYYLGSLSIEKRISYFHIALTETVAHVDSNTSIQEQVSLDYSPFGNSNLIIGFSIIPHTQNKFSTNYEAYSPYISCRPVKGLTLSASYIQNQGFNIIQYNGYYVDNILDLTTSSWSVTGEYHITPGFSIYAIYQLINEENTTKDFTYNYTLLSAGIKILPQ